MREGKSYRLGRLFGADGKALILPVDHGLTLGRIEGLEDPLAMVEFLQPLGCDAFLLSPGLTRRTTPLFADRGSPARILTLDTFFRDSPDTAAGAGLVAAVEDAARLGVDAVKLYMAWDVPSMDRQATASRIAATVAAADAVDLPVMAEPIVVDGAGTPQSSAVEGDAARVAAEIGVDIVKVRYPGAELLAAWVSELGVPVVILGGPRTGEAADVLAVAEEAMRAGASGIVMGRNVWQRPAAVTRELVARLRDIAHGQSAGQPA